MHFLSATEAVQCVKSHDHIHISSVAQIPHILLEALAERADRGELSDIHFHHSYSEGVALYADQRYDTVFVDETFFVGPAVRAAMKTHRADYIPTHLVDTQKLYRKGVVKCDVAFIVVSHPDDNGYVSLGGDVVCTLGAIEVAKTVIAVVNKFVPFAFGDARISIDRIHYFVRDNRPLEYSAVTAPTEVEQKLGEVCADLIPFGACLQMGVGGLPNALAVALKNHKHLGLHSEMFADGVMELIKSGVIDNSKKVIDCGKSVSSFLLGSPEVFKFVHENPDVLMMDIGYTNSPATIAKNPNVASVNAAVQIDLTGQVCADSVGTRIISGTGGQLDFVEGANLSENGISIIALTSRTKDGLSKIVPTLHIGAGVVTPRADVNWIATEYGAVNLYGKGLKERAKLLISIAHPDDRERLERTAFERFGRI